MRTTDYGRRQGGLRTAAGFLAMVGLAAGLLLGGTQARAGEHVKVLEVRPLNYTSGTLRVFHVEDLRFGRIIAGRHGRSTVVMDPATGYKTAHGGAHDMRGDYSRAEYEVRGKPGANFAILLPAKVHMKTKGGQVQLIDFTSAPAQFGVIGPGGRAIVYVGASLVMHPNQKPGPYTGDYDVLFERE